MSKQRGLLLVLSFLPYLAGWPVLWSQAEGQGQAQAVVRYVGIPGLDAGSCTDPSHPCSTIQYALDQAAPGDVIKIASGIYAGINFHGGLRQVAYVDKSVTLTGGYRVPGFPEPPDPAMNVTWIAAQRLGRGLVITGPISTTVRGLWITGGDAAGLGSGPGGVDAGGGVLVVKASVILEDNWIVANPCRSCLGGGLALVDGLSLLEGNHLAANEGDTGGGFAIAGGSATLRKNTVEDNGALASGGGLAILNSAVTIEANTVSGNRADVRGGGIFLEASDASVKDNVVRANSLPGSGGGVYIDGGDVSMVGNTISQNRSEGNSGGGVYLWHSNAVVTKNIIVDNVVGREGGGLYLTYSAAQLRGNHVQGNNANGQHYPDGGGGLYLNYSDAIVEGNRFLDNEANDGGGIYFWKSNATINRNVIAGNSAGNGGGLWIWLSSPTLSNNVIANNRSGQAGSGIYVLGSAPRMVHNTVAGNSGGDGTGIHVTDGLLFPDTSTVSLTNTIVVSHSVGVQVAAQNTVTMVATLWGDGVWANDTDWTGPGTVDPGTINVWGNPVFRQPSRSDYHIREGSAARDAGLDAGLTADMDGQVRPNEAGYDIGADEYWPFSYVYVPLILNGGSSPGLDGLTQ